MTNRFQTKPKSLPVIALNMFRSNTISFILFIVFFFIDNIFSLFSILFNASRSLHIVYFRFVITQSWNYIMPSVINNKFFSKYFLDVSSFLIEIRVNSIEFVNTIWFNRFNATTTMQFWKSCKIKWLELPSIYLGPNEDCRAL